MYISIYKIFQQKKKCYAQVKDKLSFKPSFFLHIHHKRTQQDGLNRSGNLSLLIDAKNTFLKCSLECAMSRLQYAFDEPRELSSECRQKFTQVRNRIFFYIAFAHFSLAQTHTAARNPKTCCSHSKRLWQSNRDIIR